MKKINLTTPLKHEDLIKLSVGDRVYLSGIIYTARDLAHKRFKKENHLPFNAKNQVIFYAGPTPGKGKKLIGSIGPTTSSRVDEFTPWVLEKGIKAFIGKGDRSPEVIAALKKHKAIYFISFGGVAALLSKYIVNASVVAYKELGPEAVYKLEVQNFPVIVAIDLKGNNIYKGALK